MPGTEPLDALATICARFVRIDLRSKPVTNQPRPHITSSHPVPGEGLEPSLPSRGRGV